MGNNLQSVLLGGGLGRQKVPYKAGNLKTGDFDSDAERAEQHAQALARLRRYEICMVFKYKISKAIRFEEGPNDSVLPGVQLTEPSEAAVNKMQIWKQQRDSILKRAQSCGLRVFPFFGRERDVVFCKIGVDADKLKMTAARMKHKLKLKSEYLGAYAEYRDDFPGRQEHNFADRRVVSHIYENHSPEDFPMDDSIFSPLDKILLTHHIITSNDKGCAGIDVSNLLHNNELKAYFALHDSYSLRELRENDWRWIFMEEDHANHVREYFGDQIAFYFIWLSFYVKFLIPIAVLGPVLQIVDLFFRTPDNRSAIPFCLLLSVWTTFLPHFWRRQEAKCALSWGSRDVAEKLESCRPEHWGEPRINPVTAQVEPYYPFEKRVWNYITSGLVVLFSGVLLILFILLLLLARHDFKEETPGGIVAFQFGLAAAVEFVNVLLSRVARFLTEKENHRTRSEHEIHQLAKVCGFKFVNSYFVLFYIAFFKNHSYLFGQPMKCMRKDCFLDLQAQLACFVLFRLFVKNTIELLRPRFTRTYNAWMTGGRFWLSSLMQGSFGPELAEMSNAEQQARKEVYSTFAEFDDTLLTHGYATLFAVTAPWVCTATLLGTLLEIYVNMRGLTETKQRPLPVKVRDNEPWSTAFEIYGVIACFTNVSLLIFGSEQYASWTLTEKLTLFLFLEHFIFLSGYAVKAVLPRDPRSVELQQLRQATVVHRALENIKVEPGTDMSIFRDRKGGEEYEVFDADLAEDEDDEPHLSLKESKDSIYQAANEVFGTDGI